MACWQYCGRGDEEGHGRARREGLSQGDVVQRALRIASAQQFHAAGVGDRGRVERDHLLPRGNHGCVVPDVELRGDGLVVHAGTDRVGADRGRREHERVIRLRYPFGVRGHGHGIADALTVRLDGEDDRIVRRRLLQHDAVLVGEADRESLRLAGEQSRRVGERDHRERRPRIARRAAGRPLAAAAARGQYGDARSEEERSASYPCDHRANLSSPHGPGQSGRLHGERCSGLGA